MADQLGIFASPQPAAPDETTQAIAEDGGDRAAEDGQPIQPSRVNLQSPYSAAEWTAIVAALRAERKRRNVEHLPRADRMAIVDEVLLRMRSRS